MLLVTLLVGVGEKWSPPVDSLCNISVVMGNVGERVTNCLFQMTRKVEDERGGVQAIEPAEDTLSIDWESPEIVPVTVSLFFPSPFKFLNIACYMQK